MYNFCSTCSVYCLKFLCVFFSALFIFVFSFILYFVCSARPTHLAHIFAYGPDLLHTVSYIFQFHFSLCYFIFLFKCMIPHLFSPYFHFWLRHKKHEKKLNNQKLDHEVAALVRLPYYASQWPLEGSNFGSPVQLYLFHYWRLFQQCLISAQSIAH